MSVIATFLPVLERFLTKATLERSTARMLTAYMRF